MFTLKKNKIASYASVFLVVLFAIVVFKRTARAGEIVYEEGVAHLEGYDDFVLSDYEYELSDSDNRIILQRYCMKNKTDIFVPMSIINGGKTYGISLGRGSISGPEYDGVFGKHDELVSVKVFEGVVLDDGYYLFDRCLDLVSIDMSGVDTSNTKKMFQMFRSCRSLESINLDGIDTSNVTAMDDMFGGCRLLESINLDSFDTSNVTSMEGMFNGCESLKSIKLDSFDTSNVKSMKDMFKGCTSLEYLFLNSFNTGNVYATANMFYDCKKLKVLDISRFNLGSITYSNEMFGNTEGLKKIYLPKNRKWGIELNNTFYEYKDGIIGNVGYTNLYDIPVKVKIVVTSDYVDDGNEPKPHKPESSSSSDKDNSSSSDKDSSSSSDKDSSSSSDKDSSSSSDKDSSSSSDNDSSSSSDKDSSSSSSDKDSSSSSEKDSSSSSDKDSSSSSDKDSSSSSDKDSSSSSDKDSSSSSDKDSSSSSDKDSSSSSDKDNSSSSDKDSSSSSSDKDSSSSTDKDNSSSSDLRDDALKAREKGYGYIGDTIALIKSGKDYILEAANPKEYLTVARGNKFRIMGGQKGTYKSSNKKYVSVSSKGVVKAKKHYGRNEGIRITYKSEVTGETTEIRVRVWEQVLYNTRVLNDDRLLYNVGARKLKMQTEVNRNIDFSSLLLLNSEFEVAYNDGVISDLEMGVKSDGRIHITGHTIRKGIVKIPYMINGKRFTIVIKVR